MKRGVKLGQVQMHRQTVTHSLFSMFIIVQFYWLGTNRNHQEKIITHRALSFVFCLGPLFLMSTSTGKQPSSDTSPSADSDASETSEDSDGSQLSDEEEQDSEDNKEEGDLCSHCGSQKKKGIMKAKQSQQSTTTVMKQKMKTMSKFAVSVDQLLANGLIMTAKRFLNLLNQNMIQVRQRTVMSLTTVQQRQSQMLKCDTRLISNSPSVYTAVL